MDVPQPRFDHEDVAFRAWLTAYLNAVETKEQTPKQGQSLEEFVTRAAKLWCTERLRITEDVLDTDIQSLVNWITGSVRNWEASFWLPMGDQGQELPAMIGIIGGVHGLTAEEQLLLNRLQAVDLSRVTCAIVVRPATLKVLHLKKPSLSLDRAEQNWAPTGTFTGGGGPGFDGRIKPINIMVSRALASARDVLLALLYEIENARRWREMEGKRLAETAGSHGRASQRADIEYEVYAENQRSLRAAYGVGSQHDLCVALGVPVPMLVQVTEGSPVPRTSPAVLRDATARNALWWYQTEQWSDEARKAAWTGAEHGGGMVGSKDLYKTTK